MSGSIEETKQHVATYMKVGATLGVMTVITVLASYLPAPVWLGIVLALIIASIKGSLVAGFFMHLVGEHKTIHWALILTAVFWVVLMFLPLLGHSDTIGVHQTLSNANAPVAEEEH
jgi:cytochrome c oxidase subunit 4